jgi:hypothetical protein
MLSPNLKSQRVQGTKREDENLPGIDCHNNPGLVVKLTVSHGQQRFRRKFGEGTREGRRSVARLSSEQFELLGE